MASVPDLSDQHEKLPESKPESENEPTKNSSTSNQESEYESANEEEVVPDLSDDSEKSSLEKVASEDKSSSEECSNSAPLPHEETPEGDNFELNPASNNDENNYLADGELSGDDVIFDEADDGDHSKLEVESNISKSSENSKAHKESKKAEAEDKRNPQYIPRKGAFYEHDDRNDDDADENSDDKEASEANKESQPVKKATTETKKEKKKPHWQTKDCWAHDRFDESQQAPKGKQELVYSYGYDIRVENEAPKLQQRSKYGNGPRKYDRKSDDLSAYTKKTTRKPVVKKDLSRDVEKGLQSSSDTSEAQSKPSTEAVKKPAENVEQPPKEKKHNAPKAERKNNQSKNEHSSQKFQQQPQQQQQQQQASSQPQASQLQAQNQSQSLKNHNDRNVNQPKNIEKQDRTFDRTERFERHDRAPRNDNKHERFDNRNDNRMRNDKFDRIERPPRMENYQRSERNDRPHKHDTRNERNNDYPQQHRPERYDRNNYNNGDRQDRFERNDRYDRNFDRYDNKNEQRFNNARNDERFPNRRPAPPPTSRDYSGPNSDFSKQDFRNGHSNRNENNRPHFKKSDFPDLPSSNPNVNKNFVPQLTSQQKKEVIYYSTKDGPQTFDGENKNMNNGIKSDKPEVVAEVKKPASQQQQQQPPIDSTPKHTIPATQQKVDIAKGQAQSQMHLHSQNMSQQPQQHHAQQQQQHHHQTQPQHQREHTPSQEQQLKAQAEPVAYYDPSTQPGAQATVAGAAAGMIPQQNYIMAYYNDPVSCHSTAGTTTAVTGLQAQIAQMAPTGYYPADQTAAAGQNNYYLPDIVAYQQAYHMSAPSYAPQNRYLNTAPSAESNRYLQTTAPIATNPSIHMFGSAINYPAGYPAFPAQTPQQAAAGQIHLGAGAAAQTGYQDYYRNAPTYYDISNARHKDGDAAGDQFDKSKTGVDVNKQLSVVNQ